MRLAWSVAVSVFLFGPLLRGGGPDEDFVRIYNLIQEGDSFAREGRDDQARQTYERARAELKNLRKGHPGWNEGVVQFRLNYVAGKLASLTRDKERSVSSPSEAQPAPQTRIGESAGMVPLLEDEVRQLRADRELLRARLKEALTAQPAAVDPRELGKAEEKIKALQKEVEMLKAKLQQAESKPAKPIDPAALEETRNALEAAQKQLALRTDTAALLALEKRALQERLRALLDDAEVKPLPQQYESLNRQLRDLKQSPGAEADTPKQQAAGLHFGPASQQAQPALIGRIPAVDVSRPPADNSEAEKNAESFEELAWLRSPESISSKGESEDVRKPSHTLPPAAAMLVAAAEQAFAAGRYEEAEQKYSEAVRFDPQNPSVLAKLAAVQIKRNRLGEAEANLRKALEVDPQNASSLYLLGVLKLRRQKYDEAFDALSRSAEINPLNPDTFRSLGVVLSEKGLRDAAESAFRRAIKLAPGNADAHHSLALIYATQRPPSIELARWHYERALDAGYPKDPVLEKTLKR